jgi:hypothetical protein
VIELLDFVQTRGLPAAAVRARVALDIVEHETSEAAPANGSRVTVASVQIDESGRAQAPAVASHGHLATLLWEILAGRVAESDELPWSDPADDLPSGVLDTFASLTLRPAKDLPELRRRFAAGIRSHVASHDEVVRGLAGPERITLRAPPVQIEALRTLSAGEAEGIVTRVCPVVSLPVVARAPVEEQPRTTLDPWHAPGSDITQSAAVLAVDLQLPRRRRTWPFVAASLAAALVVIGLASRQRITSATSAAVESTAAVSPAAAAPSSVATSAPSAATSAAPAVQSQAVASAIAKLPPKAPQRFQVALPARPLPAQVTSPMTAEPITTSDAEVPPLASPPEPPAAPSETTEPTPIE